MSATIVNYRLRYAKAASLFLFLFYAVGVIGILNPYTRNIFLVLTKYALLLNFTLLAFLHENRLNRKLISLFSGIFLSTFLIEVAGVNTGLIFGHYHYGNGLGLKLFQTPLLIGINWLMLSYSFYAVVNRTRLNAWVKATIGAFGMLCYDLLLEQSASKLDMWYWQNEQIPMQNYVAWFLIAWLIQLGLVSSKTTIHNKLALPTLLAQVLFFLVLFIAKLME